MIQQLKDAYRCGSYDQRGWGESTDVPGEKHSLAKLTSDALQVIRILNVKREVVSRVLLRSLANRKEACETAFRWCRKLSDNAE